jgi:hypothetical protein
MMRDSSKTIADFTLRVDDACLGHGRKLSKCREAKPKTS